MDLQLKDKVAIVGGASDGIGRGIALALGAEGARLAIFARREARLAPAAAAIRAATGAAKAMPRMCSNKCSIATPKRFSRAFPGNGPAA